MARLEPFPRGAHIRAAMDGEDLTHLTPKKRAEIWKPVFLVRLSETGNVKKSALKAKVSRQTAYEARKDPEFAAAWDAALECAVVGVLEPEAFRRATDGVFEPVFYQGKKVGKVRKTSDVLLMFLLKAHAPAKYSERIRSQQTTVNIDVTQLDDTQLDRIARGEDPIFVANTPGPGGTGEAGEEPGS